MPISGCGYREYYRASAAITSDWSGLMNDTPTSPDTPTTDELAALRAIVEGTARHTGQEFFESLVRHLAAAVGTRYAFVAEFAGRTRVRSLAY